MDKTKITQVATKFVQKGQYDKAIAEYRRILEKDPRDVRSLLKIGELQQKKGDNDAAASTLLDVAKTYATDGFFLKAVAVYKQVLKLAPARVDVILRLAELYQQLGLMSDAMGQLQAAAAHYEKSGDPRESAEIVRRIISMEPENVALRLRLADLLAKTDKSADALKELRSAAEKLRGSSRIEDYLRVGERIVQLDPKDQDLGRELAHAYVAKNDMRRALERLQICFQADPKNTETLDLLARAFVGVGQRAKAASVYKELARVHRERGRGADEQAAWRKVLETAPDDPEARRALGGGPSAPPVAPPTAPTAPTQRPAAPPRLEISAAPLQPATPPPPPPSGSWPTAAGRVPVVPRAEPSQPRRLEGSAPRELSWPAGSRPEPSQTSAVGATSPLAKLLTETDVFVKYGLSDKARLHLQRIFALDPECVPAHEKAVTLLRGRDPAGLLTSLAALARLCVRNGEIERGRPHFEELRSLAPTHAEVVNLGPIYASAVPVQEIDDDLILATGAEYGENGLPLADEPLLLPIDGGEEPVLLEAGAVPAFAPVNEDALFALAGAPADDVVDEPLLQAPEDEPLATRSAIERHEAALALLARDERSHGPADESTIDVEVVGPEQTIDLVLDSGDALDDDVTRAAPDLGDAEGRTELALLSVAGSTTLAHDAELTPFALQHDGPTDEIDVDAITARHAGHDGVHTPGLSSWPAEPGLAPEPSARPRQNPANPWRVGDRELSSIVTELDEAEFYLQQGFLDEAEELFRAVDRRVPGHQQAADRLAEIAARRREQQAELDQTPGAEATVFDRAAPPQTFTGTPALDDALAQGSLTPPPPLAGEEELFDLGAALAEELGEDEPLAAVESFQYKAEDVLEEFKAGVARTVRPEDVDTHYNLAIAYKEMGLLSDAVDTFELALSGCEGEPRAVDCATMIGICHGMLGQHERAVAAFEKGLEVPGLQPETEKALHFEIAQAYEAAGQLNEALAAFGRVARIDGAFRNVKAEIARLVAAGAVPRQIEPPPPVDLAARRAGSR